MTKDTLSKAVERFFVKYFEDHGHNLPPPGLYDRILREVEEPLLKITLLKTSWNQQKAAKILGMSRNTLRKKIESFQLMQ